MCIVKVGCCGFPVARARYFEQFRLVEVQQTFYKLPTRETLERWRREAPQDFEYTVKAWQVVTHPPSSPTWRKAGLKPEPGKEDRYGLLRPTPENFEAWKKTVEAADILNARIIVVQTPPSFGYSEENLRNALEFFREAAKYGKTIGWEPRGTWHEHPEAIRRIVEETGVIHVVDLLRRWPVVVGRIAYVRLHGLGGREVNYRYKYTDQDLEELVARVKKLCSEGAEEVYVLFNNVYMFDDARRFREKARNAGLDVS
ncbi:protein of unknown function DUF72 [Pyrolobus fumarii 1A]|uniref:DUF72 domain-containing protein n=1 Tax=Pyrolobus fumarii (strain DSM 11204 / 1A) TaxID=694429 RepID=G0ECM1_PYRF1|nr:DUF72 domain-containing protein [Pyrolobus fumarii]AEM39591.1 protein of unknown function DUF72 [Pyrolobus fumarii 1A]